jgi:FKBP-type peptidyl-prolyl cis-trans isomerase FkpA
MNRRGLPTLAAVATSLVVSLASAQDGPPGDGAAPAPAQQAAGATTDAATTDTTATETQPAQAQPVEAAPAGPAPVTHAGPQLLTEDLRKGFGDVAHSGMILTVHYTGWLYEPGALGYRGKKFDSSRDRGQPFQFMLGAGRVIKGWEVGIVGMQVGGLRRLVIPPEMAYGSRNVGDGLIPPDSTLVFEVELLGVESASFEQGAK